MKKHNVYTALAVAALLTTGTLTMSVNATNSDDYRYDDGHHRRYDSLRCCCQSNDGGY